MILSGLAFYLFAGMMLASSVMVISSKNPVHSVMFLILAFFNAAGLFVLMGAEFLAMILVVVYVGAVAVLFLFVVMMLDINIAELRQGFLQHLPLGGVMGLILVIELGFLFAGWKNANEQNSRGLQLPTPAPDAITNTDALGRVLYTDYVYLFQASGMILLVAMIGAIVLTLRQRTGVRRQKISSQISLRRDEAVAIRQVQSGKGS